MQRLMVIGPPGSGKSTLARRLGMAFGLPVFHLDQAFHQPGWIPVPHDVFHAEVQRIAALPEWVIDGNYLNTIAPRIRNADTLIYLECSRWLSALRVIRRSIALYGQIRPDGPKGCPERLSFEFLHFVWTWNRIRRASHIDLLAAFSGRKIILRGAGQQKQFLRGLLAAKDCSV